MNCTEAREAMLVAEPSELRGGPTAVGAAEALDGLGDSPLDAHLMDCDTCRRLAGLLAADMDGLSFRLRARSARRTLVLAALPVAAVLVATVTFVARRSPQTAPPIQSRADDRANVVSVDVGVGQRAVVIKTADPKITLVWISTGAN